LPFIIFVHKGYIKNYALLI